MKLSDYIVKYLEKITDSVFLLSGGGIMHLVDSLGRSNLDVYCCHHEQAAATAAEGHARIKNKLFPERTISVGDSDSELKTAERLGIRFIALANESNDFSERSDLRYVLYADLTKLLDIINKINKEN